MCTDWFGHRRGARVRLQAQRVVGVPCRRRLPPRDRSTPPGSPPGLPHEEAGRGGAHRRASSRHQKLSRRQVVDTTGRLPGRLARRSEDTPSRDDVAQLSARHQARSSSARPGSAAVRDDAADREVLRGPGRVGRKAPGGAGSKERAEHPRGAAQGACRRGASGPRRSQRCFERSGANGAPSRVRHVVIGRPPSVLRRRTRRSAVRLVRPAGDDRDASG